MDYDTRRCTTCGLPSCDHAAGPPRYALKTAMRHYLIEKIRVLSKGWR